MSRLRRIISRISEIPNAVCVEEEETILDCFGTFVADSSALV
jgi:hypothetical protein